jgi:hypothetical protein
MVCYRKRVDVEERFGDIAQKISEKYVKAYEKLSGKKFNIDN